MSLNCPEFQPHSVKPTRCKRCFNEYKDHNFNSKSLVAVNNFDQKKSFTKNNSSSNSSQSIHNKEDLEPKSETRVQNDCFISSSSLDNDDYSKKNENTSDNKNQQNSNNNEIFTSFIVSVIENSCDNRSPNRLKIISATEETKINQDDVEFVLKFKPDQCNDNLDLFNKLNTIDLILTEIINKLDNLQKSFFNDFTDTINSYDQNNQFKVDLSLSKTKLEKLDEELKQLELNYNKNLDNLAIDSNNQIQTKLKESRKTVNICKETITLLEAKINFNSITNNELVEKIQKIDNENFDSSPMLDKMKVIIKSLSKLDLKNQIDSEAFIDLSNQSETRCNELEDQLKYLNNRLKNDVMKLNKKNQDEIKSSLNIEKKKVFDKKLKEDFDQCQKNLAQNDTLTSKINKTNEVEVKEDNYQSTLNLNKNETKLVASNSTKVLEKYEFDNLNEQLIKSKKLCSELMQEREEYVKKVQLLEQELEELHDSFREDQMSEYRDIKKELETASKNIRILQFKLKKSERYCSQIENEKLNLENKMKKLIETSLVSDDKQKMKDIQNELAIAKEISLKLHTEIESIKKAKLNHKINSDLSNHSIIQSDFSFDSPSNDSKDYQELVRSLYDTIEREKDLQEQLKFSEEEARVMRKKLTTIEQENEILMIQIKKLARKKSKSEKVVNNNEENDELSIEELQLHLDLYEEEVTVLRKKIEEYEIENDNLQQEIKYLQEKLISQPVLKVEMPETSFESSPNLIYEHKIKLLESEVQDLRKKLIEKEKGNETLRIELDLHRRKAIKFINKNKTLENEIASDLRRKLQIKEQEITIFRQKIMTLESENEKLLNNGKKIKMTTERRSSLESKFPLQSDLLKNSIENCENDLINSLKQQLLTKEKNELQLTQKITELEIEVSKVSLDYKKLKESFSFKKKNLKIVKESATRLELKEIIKELEQEIDLIYSNLTASKEINETLNRDFTQIKQQFELVQIDLRNKETRFSSQSEIYNQKIESLEKKLKYYEKQNLNNVDPINQLISAQIQIENLKKELEETIEGKVEMKSKLDKINKELDSSIKLKKELETKNESNQKNKEKLELEYNSIKEKASELEEKLGETLKIVELKNLELESAQNNCEKLKKQLKEGNNNVNSITLSNEVNKNKDLYKNFQDFQEKNESLNCEIKKLIKEQKSFKEKMKETNQKLNLSCEKVLKVEKEKNLLQNESESLKKRLNQANQELDQIKLELKENKDKHRLQSLSFRKEKDEWEIKLKDQEAQIRLEQRKREKIEKNSETVLKGKEEIIIQLKEKIFFLERELKRTKLIQDQEKINYEMEIKNLERELNKAKNEASNLNKNHTNLVDEMNKIKADYNLEKENFFKELTLINQKYDDKVKELKTFKNLFADKQEEWLQERLDLQQDLRERERILKTLENNLQHSNVIQTALTNKQEIEKDKKFLEKIKNVKNENQKLKDMNEILINQGEEVNVGLNKSEICYQIQLTNLKADYEEKLKLLCNEIDSLIEKRDQLELKIRMDKKRAPFEMKNEKIEKIDLEIQSLRQNLERALNENQNLKIEYDYEKNLWHVQSNELKSKINQLKEKNLIDANQSNQGFLRSKLEIAWQKERQEFQQLLSESQKLTEDFKNKLILSKVSKDKKQDEATKEIKKLKKLMKEKQEKNQKRVSELNFDLIHLRESYSQLQTEHEKINKEKINLEKEKEAGKIRLFAAINVENKLIELWQDFERLNKVLLENEKKTSNYEDNIELKEIKKFLENFKSKADQMLNMSKLKENTYRKSLTFKNALSSFEIKSKPIYNLDPFARMPPIGYKKLSKSLKNSKSKSKKYYPLDQNTMKNSSSENFSGTEDESLSFSPKNSILNLKQFPSSNHRYSTISGYESEGLYGFDSYKKKRQGSFGNESDTSAPAATCIPPKSKKSLFNLLKRTKSVDSTYSNFEENEKVKKEKGLKFKISKTFKKTLSLSSSLEEKSKEEKQKENLNLQRNSNVRPLNVYL